MALHKSGLFNKLDDIHYSRDLIYIFTYLYNFQIIISR